MEAPEIRYAKSGDVSIAYQVAGRGPIDLVLVPGFVSHLEVIPELPRAARVGGRLASFARAVFFDKRGTGLSDPVATAPTLEQRMDDVRAVMDAAGIERAALMGVSEGGPMCILFAATYPERTAALVLYGCMARTTQAPDYPWANTREALLEASQEFTSPYWGQGIAAETFAPSLADDPEVRRWAAKFERSAATPAMLGQIYAMFLDIDVRAILPSVRVPTLVLHRRGDRVVNWRAGKYLAEHIPGARFVLLEGSDHAMWGGDSDAVVDEVQEFLTGVRGEVEPDRVLATVVFTDIVGSTERAAQMGDRAWKELLDRHDAAVQKRVEAWRGRVVKTTGDGCMATFDGPGRAIRCALAMRDELRATGIDIRAGIHTGEIEVRGDDIGGIAVHIGARVSALAGAGEVLVSGSVPPLVAGSGISFTERGTHALKGVPGEWQIFAVAG